MDSIAHTPGPWKVSKLGHDDYLLSREPWIDPATSSIATVRCEQDARLIAAAPDLLATIESIWTLALEQPEFTGFCDEIVVRCQRVAVKARGGWEKDTQEPPA